MTSRNPHDIDMAEGLDAATNLLNSALDHYSKTCSNLKLRYLPGYYDGISPEFANRVLQELSVVASYATEIQQSKATISRLHNFSGSTNIRSIFSLPTEVLARIFRTVCNMQPCPQSGMYVDVASFKPPSFAVDPIILSHVCSFWREVVINSADIWSHIDLVPNQFQMPRWWERANTYLARSAQTLLDVHIGQTPNRSGENNTRAESLPADPNFLELISAIAPRMRSLTMSANRSPTPGMFCHSVLSTCFANCVPGRLVYLDFNFAGGSQAHYFLANHTAANPTPVGLPEEKLEDLWHSIKFIRLSEFYPAWTSQVYHGLLELNLGGAGSIPESGLIAILKSSPGIRVFKISFPVTHRTSDGSRITPVSLVDLEHLSVSSDEEPQLGYVLRLIAPGTKPLGLTLLNPWLRSTRARPVNFTSKPEARSFFARANVTRLYANSFDSYKQVEYILAMLPSVRVLVLDGCRCRRVPEESTLPPDFTLDELYVIRSTEFGAVNWSIIEWMAEKHHIRKLMLWWYDHRYNGLGEDGTVVVPDNLYVVCPVVNAVSDENPNPIIDWQ